MKLLNRLLLLFMALHTALIRLSRGRLGTRFFGLRFLLLHSTGRRTGRTRVTPISYFASDGYYFLVGSNWARRRNAAWYFNLMAHPQAVVEVEGQSLPVRASEVSGAEYERLWRLALASYPAYQRYKMKAGRHIPIVKLERE